MNSLLILASIASSVATALSQDPNNPRKVTEFAGYLNLATALATRLTAGSADLKVLDDQIKEGLPERRGLTSEQRAEWRARDDLATDVASEWLADHPKGK